MRAYTYAVADLHGHFDLLTMALERIEAHATRMGAEKKTVVFLGDYIDRGPMSAQVIHHLQAGPSDGWDWKILKGNHEDIAVQCLRGRAAMDWWIGNGGGATLLSYGQKAGERPDPRVVPESDVEWMDGLPLIHFDDHRVFAHAAVDERSPLSRQSPHHVLWHLYPDYVSSGWRDRHLVHGHHQHADGPRLLGNRTALDTGAYYTNRLVVAVFEDDLPGQPRELIELRTS